jgi:hypothetical protein
MDDTVDNGTAGTADTSNAPEATDAAQVAQEEARSLHIKHLIQRLHATYPDDVSAGPPQDVAPEPTPITTLLLSASPDLFVQWLKTSTRGVEKLRFPASGGYFSLEPAHEVASNANDAMHITNMAMHGLFREESGGTFVELGLINIMVIALRDGIAVQTRCRQSAVSGYYHRLLAEIMERWQ